MESNENDDFKLSYGGNKQRSQKQQKLYRTIREMVDRKIGVNTITVEKIKTLTKKQAQISTTHVNIYQVKHTFIHGMNFHNLTDTELTFDVDRV